MGKANHAELVRLAKALLRGRTAGPAELLKTAHGLKRNQAFDLARRLLVKARGEPNLEPALRTKLAQQLALCTYKDANLPEAARLDRAQTIIEEVLLAAEVLAEHAGSGRAGSGRAGPGRAGPGRAGPGRAGDAAAVAAAQETLGIAGAIHKRRFDVDGQAKHLAESIRLYDKGRALGIASDEGYTAVNAAFVRDLLADQIEGAGGPGAAGSADGQRRAAGQIRDDILAELAPDRRTPAGDWWRLVTVAEALFGVGRYDEAGLWLADARRVETNRRDTDNPVQPWEIEATLRQLAQLVRLREGCGTPLDALSRTPAWATLEAFVDPRPSAKARAAVESAFLGKVGLALSGGGFRASLFHVGVLARLADLDVLRHVEVLSCVSGGSVIGAHYYLALRNLLHEKAEHDLTQDDYVRLVDQMARHFLAVVQTNPRMSIFRPSLAGKWMFRPHQSRTMALGEVLEQDLYGPVVAPRSDGAWHGRIPLSGLFIEPKGEGPGFAPKYHNWSRTHKVPVLILNATTLNTCHNWQFTASWMGESPALIDPEVDGNERLRRMYYAEAPDAPSWMDNRDTYRHFPLGLAVAASAGVPGLFAPVKLPGLYAGRTVQLVDGGVHDNQGIGGLLEQDCRVLLVSDASGQTGVEADPSGWVMPVLSRSNNILMTRVRESAYHGLRSRQKASLLRGVMFLHLKKGLSVADVDWIDCDTPTDAPDRPNAGRPIDLTGYGIRARVQELLAGIRTDLDAFCDAEAYALMTSGYRMAEEDFARSMAFFPAARAEPAEWFFLAAEPLMTQGRGSERFMDVLRCGSRRLGKARRLKGTRPWAAWGALTALAGLAALVAYGLIRLLELWLHHRPAAVLFGLVMTAFLIPLILLQIGLLAACCGLPYWLARRADRSYLAAGSVSAVLRPRP